MKADDSPTIDDDMLVTLDVMLYDAQGDLLEKSDAPLTYLHGHGDIFTGIEDELRGKQPGARVQVRLEPEEAFGEYDPELVTLVPAEELGEGAAVGMQVDGATVGTPTCVYTITDLAEGMAVLDGNHPLAGLALRFDIKVLEVRAATPDELEAVETAEVPDFLRIVPPAGRTLH